MRAVRATSPRVERSPGASLIHRPQSPPRMVLTPLTRRSRALGQRTTDVAAVPAVREMASMADASPTGRRRSRSGPLDSKRQRHPPHSRARSRHATAASAISPPGATEAAAAPKECTSKHDRACSDGSGPQKTRRSNGRRPSLRGRHAKKRRARAAKRPGCSCDTVRQYEGVPPPAGRCGTGRRTCQKFSSCQISLLTATHLSSSRGCSLSTRACRPGHEWSLRREQGTAIGGPWPRDSPRGPLFGSSRGTRWLAAARRHACSREGRPFRL